MSIGALAGLNALTFLLAYLGFWHISKSLQNLEPEFSSAKELNKENYWQHLLDSLKVLLGLKNVVRLLLVSIFGQVTLNILTPVATLLLLKRPFWNLQIGQSIAVLIILSSAGLILGNILSGSLLKKLSTKLAMYSSQVFEGFILCGFFWQNFLLVLIASIQSAINLFSMAVPSVLSILLIAIASSMGIIYILLPLVLMLVLSFYLIIPMENFKTDSDSC